MANETSSRVPDSLQRLISQWESDHSLLETSQLSRRMEVLDRLDAYFPDAALPNADSEIRNELHQRANNLRTRLEAANSKLYQSIRQEIQRGLRPGAFTDVVSSLKIGKFTPSPDLGYDYLDELVSGVLQFEAPTREPLHSGPEIVPYQPTPARHIFSLIASGAVSEDDVLVDLGSGLGHVPLLASICAGARSIGVELESSYVACARQCAQRLNLSRVSFLEGDARNADLFEGTVFYLYTPFTGSILQDVMGSLREQATRRWIKVCTFGPCTPIVAKESWLEAMTNPETNRITVFQTCS